MSEFMRNSTTCLIVLMLAPVIVADDSSSKADKAEVEKSSELSVPPMDLITRPDDCPDWVANSVDYDEHADTIVVVSGPSETIEESIEELKLMRRAAISTYIASLTESGNFDFYPISEEEIERDLVVRTYEGEVLQGDVTAYEHAVEMIFTDEKRQQIMAAWKNIEVRDRLGALGVLVFLGLSVLICSSAFLGLVCRRVARREQAQSAALAA